MLLQFFLHTLEQPLSELEVILNENSSTKISIIPFVNALRQTRYVHIRLLYIWSLALDHDQIVCLVSVVFLHYRNNKQVSRTIR